MCVNLLKYTEHYVVDNHSLCMDIIIVVIVIITIIIIIIIVFRVRAMFINLPGLMMIAILCYMIGLSMLSCSVSEPCLSTCRV